MSDADRIAEALERIANSMELSEGRLTIMENERGPVFMDYLASGADANRAVSKAQIAIAENHELASAESRDRMAMIESFKVKDDECKKDDA